MGSMKRNYEIDIIKALCIISIVFAHAGHKTLWFRYIFLFGFYFASGMVFKIKPFKIFFWTKIKRIYLVFIISNIFASCVVYLLNRLTGYAWNGIGIEEIVFFNYKYNIMAPSWFLLPTFCISFIMYLLLKYIKKDYILFLVGIASLMSVVMFKEYLNGVEWNHCAIMTNVLIGLFCYICGYIYNKTIGLQRFIIGKCGVILFLFSVIILFAARFLQFEIDLRVGYINKPILMIVVIVGGIYFWLYTAKVINKYAKLSKILAYIGQRSMSIMLFHIMSFNVVTLFNIFVLHYDYQYDEKNWQNIIVNGYTNVLAYCIAGILVPLAIGYIIDLTKKHLKNRMKASK